MQFLHAALPVSNKPLTDSCPTYNDRFRRTLLPSACRQALLCSYLRLSSRRVQAFEGSKVRFDFGRARFASRVLESHRYPPAPWLDPLDPLAVAPPPYLLGGGVLPPRDLRGLPSGGGLGVLSCPPPFFYFFIFLF